MIKKKIGQILFDTIDKTRKGIKFYPKKQCFGSANPNHKYYLIRRNDEKAGLCSYLITVLGHMNYAISKGYIPIVDMLNYKSPFLDEGEFGKVNAWELYFEQSHSVEEVYQSKCVYMGCTECLVERPNDSMYFFENEKNVVEKWHKIYLENIVIKPTILTLIQKEYDELIAPTDRVLGVLCRGTDYTKNRPRNHPVQPQIEDVIIKAQRIMEEKKCNKLFLATEDKNILENFKKVFGVKLIYNKSIKIDNFTDEWIADIKNDRPRDNYLKGLEYLTTICILARCNCLLAGRTSGSVMAMVMSKGFEYQYVWDLGRYGEVE